MGIIRVSIFTSCCGYNNWVNICKILRTINICKVLMQREWSLNICFCYYITMWGDLIRELERTRERQSSDNIGVPGSSSAWSFPFLVLPSSANPLTFFVKQVWVVSLWVITHRVLTIRCSGKNRGNENPVSSLSVCCLSLAKGFFLITYPKGMNNVCPASLLWLLSRSICIMFVPPKPSSVK